MLFSTIFSVSAAVSAYAFTIPPGQKPGAYLARRGDNGTVEHIPLALLERWPDNVDATDNSLSAADRDKTDIWCGCGLTMPPAICNLAVQGLLNQMGFQTGEVSAAMPGEWLV